MEAMIYNILAPHYYERRGSGPKNFSFLKETASISEALNKDRLEPNQDVLLTEIRE